MPAHSLPSFEDMLDQLFATPSISSMIPAHDMSNRPLVELLAGWADTAGFLTEIQPVPDAPGKVNLVAVMGEGPGGLILAGHTDTVPYDIGAWQHDPFRATFTDDRVYGLGATDMKSFFAFALAAAARCDGRRLCAPLMLVATADEESTMSGARALAATSVRGERCAIIGEPTGLRPVRAHKGIMMEALRVRGHSGHSSDPALGANAIDGMRRVLDALADWRDELRAAHTDPQFHVPFPTMNFGHVHGGDNPNRICPDCVLQLDLRPLPGMDIESLRGELRHRATAALSDTPFGIDFEALFGGVPAMQVSADHELVRTAEELTGHGAEAVAFATEAPHLAALGVTPVVLGPGDIDQAHQPDEYLALERVAPMHDILDGLIGKYCIA